MSLIHLPLHVLCRILTGLATDPLSILAFGFTCRRANEVASDEQLVWKPLCTALGWPATPEAWGASSFKHLVLALVHPCTPLLGDWTSPDVFPTGRLLRVEARPPQVLGVSLYYRTLNGPPNCHAVFHVQLPASQQGAAPRKAVVSCLKRSQQQAGSSTADDSHPASLVLSSDRRSFHLRCAASCNAGLCEAICRHSYAQAYDPDVGPVLALPSSVRSGSSAGVSSTSSPAASDAPGAEGASATAASCHLWPSSCSDNSGGWPEINVRPWDAGLVQMGSILALSSTLSHRQCTPVYSRLHWPRTAGVSSGAEGTGGPAERTSVAAAADGTWPNATTAADPSLMGAPLSLASSHTAMGGPSQDAELLLPPDVLLLQGMWRGTYGCHGVELISVSLMQLVHDIDEPPPAKPQAPTHEELLSAAAGALGQQRGSWGSMSAPSVRAEPWQQQQQHGEQRQGLLGNHAAVGSVHGSWGSPLEVDPPGHARSSSSGAHHGVWSATPQAHTAAAAAAAGGLSAAMQQQQQQQQHGLSAVGPVLPLSSPNLPWVLPPAGLHLVSTQVAAAQQQQQQQQQQQLGSLAGSGSSVLLEEDLNSEEQELLQMALPSNDYDSEPDSLSDVEDAESGGVVLYEPTLSSESDREDDYLLDQAGSNMSLGGAGPATGAAAAGAAPPTAAAAAGGLGGGSIGASSPGGVGVGGPLGSSGSGNAGEAAMTGWGSSMTRSFSGVLLADAFGASARPGPLLWHPTAAAAAAAARAPLAQAQVPPSPLGRTRSRLAVMTSGPPFTPGVVLLSPRADGSSSSEHPGTSAAPHSSQVGQVSSLLEQGVPSHSSDCGGPACNSALGQALRSKSEAPPVGATAADVLLRQLRGSSYAAGVAALPAAGSPGSSSMAAGGTAAAPGGLGRLSAPAAGWDVAAGTHAWAPAAGGPSNMQQPAGAHGQVAPTGAGAADQLMQLFQRQQQQQQQQQLAEAATDPGHASAQLAALTLSHGSSSQRTQAAAAAAAAAGGLGAAAGLEAVALPLSSTPAAARLLEQQQADLGSGQTYWYAVGRKVTGDLNVPAGKVSFVVDVSSRSTEHSGEVLALPLGYDTDVALHKTGTRRLVERVRYQGRAQLAFHGFERPSVIGAELLLFEDNCFGLLWHGQVQSLSLYVRVSRP